MRALEQVEEPGPTSLPRRPRASTTEAAKGLRASLWETEGRRRPTPHGPVSTAERGAGQRKPEQPKLCAPFPNAPKDAAGSVKSGLTAMTRACHSTAVTAAPFPRGTHTAVPAAPACAAARLRPSRPSRPFWPGQPLTEERPASLHPSTRVLVSSPPQEGWTPSGPSPRVLPGAPAYLTGCSHEAAGCPPSKRP